MVMRINMPDNDLDLLRMQADALFVHDGSGKLLRINEPEPGDPAPRFFLGRSAAGNLWRTRADLPDDLAGALDRLAADEPVASDFPEAPRHAAEYRELLEQHAPITMTEGGPAYWLSASDTAHEAVTITAENVTLLETHFAWLVTTLADYAPVAVAVVNGIAVAVCFCSRITAQVCEAGVYTEANSRGHGYATEAVRGWSAGVRAEGMLPLYSTSWTNYASQAIARKLGAVQYGADFSIT
jgi:RimJ/RimL family protein N-acetyltransferase